MKNALKYLKTYIIHQKELDYKPQQGGAKPVDNLQRWSTCRTRDHPEIRNPFTDQGEIRPRNLRFKCIVHAQLDCSKSLSKPKTISGRYLSNQRYAIQYCENASETFSVLTKFP